MKPTLLRCSDLPEGFFRWSLRLLADKVVELNYIDSISQEPPGSKENKLKPWRCKSWVIASGSRGEFVARMEMVLDVYKRQYDPGIPAVCMDESPKQHIGETRSPIRARPGQLARNNYEYRRCRTRSRSWEWAEFIEKISIRYPEADRITLVMDNYGTHKLCSLQERFTLEKALVSRFLEKNYG